MFGRLFKSLLSRKPPPAAAAPDPSAARHAARMQAYHAQRALYEARYAELVRQLPDPCEQIEPLLEIGHLCYQLDRDVEGEAVLLRALALDPANPVALCGLGLLLQTYGRFAESEHYLRRALAVAPDERSIRYGLAMALMSRGNYPEGYALFAARLAGPVKQGAQIAALPAWRGEALEGKTLVLWSDWGGFGDDLAFVRYARAIRERVRPARIIVAAPRPLVRLFAGQPYIDAAISLQDSAAADLQCSFIEAARVMDITVDSVPAWPAYLQAPAPETGYWRTQLANQPRPLVGLAWSGGAGEAGSEMTTGRLDKHLDAGNLAELRGLPGIRFVSLQKGAHTGRIADMLPDTDAIDDTESLGDFADTAALVSQLDLVVAVDTAVAHLAGALGRPVLLVLKKSSAHFWLEERSDSPWYPSMRIARQQVHGDWSQPMARVRATLERMAAGTPWPACFDQA